MYTHTKTDTEAWYIYFSLEEGKYYFFYTQEAREEYVEKNEWSFW